jgi:hypothetical protein
MTLETYKVISDHGVEIPLPTPGMAFIWEIYLFIYHRNMILETILVGYN